MLITCADRDGARRLLVDGEPVTPTDLQVRAVETVDGPGVVFLANPIDDATVLQVWRRTPDGQLEALTDEPGVHTVAAGGGTIVVRTATLAEPGAQWGTLDGVELVSFAATPVVRADVHLSFLGDRRIATAVLLPAEHDGSPLPVLVDPYGGPHAGRVVRAHNAHVGAQWMADQGFAVVVADGRGTPGRGSAWERAVHLDLATAVLEDQVEALQRAADEHGVLDLERVAIRGWSFGGYLAALAVLRRPDVFHAAIAGAPVTEWRLYDTHYTERYLGDPTEHPDVYDANSLLPLAEAATRPLLLIHGLADDNVVAAHTLRLSSALLAAGRPHEVLPLVGVTHMTPQEVVAENLLLHQLDFLRRALGLDAARSERGLRCAVMEKRLDELYEGVAVHVTADREHMAALELLALVMLADSHLSDDELDVLRELTEDWRGSAFSFEQYLGPAVAKARAAFASHTVTELLDDIDARITSRILRKALFSAARQMVGDNATPAEEDPPVGRRGPLRLSPPSGRDSCHIVIWAGFVLRRRDRSRPDHGRAGDGHPVAAGEVGPDLDVGETARPGAAPRPPVPDRRRSPAPASPPAGSIGGRRPRARRMAARPSAPANTACAGSQRRTA